MLRVCVLRHHLECMDAWPLGHISVAATPCQCFHLGSLPARGVLCDRHGAIVAMYEGGYVLSHMTCRLAADDDEPVP